MYLYKVFLVACTVLVKKSQRCHVKRTIQHSGKVLNDSFSSGQKENFKKS